MVDIFGKIKMPVSFSFTNQKATFGTASLRSALPVAQPFNRINLKPRYKGHTVHLGTSALTFSPYTLSGFRFNGLGYEYKGKSPIYGGLMFGNLLRPVQIDSSGLYPNNKPAYGRRGFSSKLGYKKEDDFIEMTLFNGIDRVNSLPYRLDVKNIFPEENLATSFSFQKKFYKKIFLSAEIARTSIFRQEGTLQRSFGNQLAGLVSGSRSTDFKQAIKSSIEYKQDKGNIGFEYSWVDPQYKTFGGYFFNNDLETYALKSNWKFKEDKITMIADLGRQRSNLDLSQVQSQKRIVWNLGTNFKPNDKLDLAFGYSTFSSFSNFQNQFLYLTAIDPFQDLDTLNYRQINQNLTGNLQYKLPAKSSNVKNSISVVALFQGGIDEQGLSKQKNSLKNLNFVFNQNFEKSKVNYGLGFNLVDNKIPQMKDLILGPMAMVTYPIIKEKLIFNSNLSYNASKTKNIEELEAYTKKIFLANVGLNATIKKNHKISLTAIHLYNNNARIVGNKNDIFNETTLNLGYNYSFKVFDLKFK